MTNFVLVHGSWHGGWCWQRIAPLLEIAGHRVYRPTLTGLADRAHLLTRELTLDTHIEDISRVLFYEDLHEVVLVGHSYSGMVISGVAVRAPERVRQLVYLDAYIAADGQSVLDLWSAAERAAALEEITTGSGRRAMPRAAHLGVTDPVMADWVEARLTPHPLSTYLQPGPNSTAASRAIPRAFIHCNQGPTVARFGAFAETARGAGWAVREIAAGHDVMLTHPQELVRELLDLSG